MASGLNPNLKFKSDYRLTEEARDALQSGDVGALMKHHQGRWVGLTMMAEQIEPGSDADDQGAAGGRTDGDPGSNDDNDDGDDRGIAGSSDVEELKAQLQRMEKRMKASDQRADKAENRLREIADAEKGELDKATDQVSALEQEVNALKDELLESRMSNSFLSANKHNWFNPSAALRLGKAEGYLDDVIEDGEVDEKSLVTALNSLAKDHPYLVQPAQSPSGPSGQPNNGRSGNSGDDKASKESDRRRAPALSRRQ